MLKLRHLLLAGSCLAAPLNAIAYELIGPTWPNGNITFDTSVPGSAPSGIKWSAAMQQAARKWTDQVEGLQVNFTQDSRHPCAGLDGLDSPYPDDGNKSTFGFDTNVCGSNFGNNVIAVTLSWTSKESASAYAHSDIVFNDNESWDIYDGTLRSALDFRRVAVHEFGHLIGLDHEEDARAIMAPVIGNITAPTEDDLNGARALYSPPGQKMNLEEPRDGQRTSGISNVRGWALSASGISKVELYLDGKLQSRVPYGSKRSDVAAAYPEYSNAANSGYSMIFNWGAVSPGPHTLTVRSYGNDGKIASRSANVIAQGFANPYVANPDKVQILSDATVDGRAITLDKVLVDGSEYRVILDWNTDTQRWDIKSIER